MKQRIAIVTGGIGGLGTHFCRHLAAQGATVIAADLDDREKVEGWRESLGDRADRCHFQEVDVADFDSCGTLVARVEEDHGSVDILVNAAGITRDVTMKKMEPQQWREVLRINLDGAFHMCRHAISGMIDRRFGRIVNISSVNGQTGSFGQTNYSAAKAGLHGMTMALARETAAKGVTVNSVSPGFCETKMVAAIPERVREKIISNIPVGRLCRPEEIARVVAFLSHDDSGYITGANVPVNGGYYMS